MFEFYASEFDNCQLFLTTADDIVDVHTQFEKQWKRNEEQIQIGHDHIGIIRKGLACVADGPRRFRRNVCLGAILNFGRGETEKERKSDKGEGSGGDSPAPLTFVTTLLKSTPLGHHGAIKKNRLRLTIKVFLFFILEEFSTRMVALGLIQSTIWLIQEACMHS